MSMTLTPDKRSRIVRPSLALILTLCAMSLTACVANVSSQVKGSDKDQSGAYDGRWIANVQKSAGRQSMPGNWVANCNGDPWKFELQVHDGVARSNLRGAAAETAFVSATGDFRFEIPVKREAKAAAGSNRSLGLVKQTLIVYGNLKKAKGRFTSAVAEFGNGGCTAIIEFDKPSA